VRYLVTGAAGFIGSHLAEALVAGGHDVAGVDCFTDYYDHSLKAANAAALDVLRADLAAAPLEPLLAGVDGVFHLAGQPGVRGGEVEPALYIRRNVLATQRLVRAAEAAGIRLVLASSSSIYGDAERYPTPEDARPRPRSFYGVTKLAAERVVRASRVEAVVLRYFTVYGPRQRPDMAFAQAISALHGGAPYTLYGGGRQTRSFTFVADAVAATTAAMERAPAGAVYNVGGGAEVTLRDALAALERLAGRRLRLDREALAAVEARRTAPDTTRIRRELGWEPRVGLEAGLASQWEAGLPAAALAR
jgi:UDP-glucuronate 4-epimerase